MVLKPVREDPMKTYVGACAMLCGQNLPKSGQSKLRAGQKCLQDFEKVTQGKYCSRNVDYCDFLNSFFI